MTRKWLYCDYFSMRTKNHMGHNSKNFQIVMGTIISNSWMNRNSLWANIGPYFRVPKSFMNRPMFCSVCLGRMTWWMATDSMIFGYALTLDAKISISNYSKYFVDRRLQLLQKAMYRSLNNQLTTTMNWFISRLVRRWFQVYVQGSLSTQNSYHIFGQPMSNLIGYNYFEFSIRTAWNIFYRCLEPDLVIS